MVAKLQGLYRADQEHADHSTADDIVKVFYLVTIGVWILLVSSRLIGRTSPGIYALITFWAVAICFLPLVRTVTRRLCRGSRAYVQNTLILGAGEVGQLIARKLVKHPEYGLNVVGFIDRQPKARRGDLPEHLAILGGPERLADVVKSLDVERVIIAFSKEPVDELLVLLRQLRAFPVQIDLVPRLFELVGPRVTVHSVEGLPLLGLPPNHPSPVARALKRAIDITVSGLALIILAPLFAYIALRIRLDSDGPVFFRQTRLGTNMKEFTALKFRTMKVDTDAIGPPGGGPPVERSRRRPSRDGHVQARARGRGDRFWPRPAPHQPRRASPADKRAPRRHVACRPPPVHPLRDGELRAPPPGAIRHASRHHRPLAGHRPRQLHFPRGAGDGCRLRARLVAGPRPPPAAPHPAPTAPPASVDRLVRAPRPADRSRACLRVAVSSSLQSRDDRNFTVCSALECLIAVQRRVIGLFDLSAGSDHMYA